ncbi:uncharacterized protein LOC144129531 [Amblyomma americanum]
MPNRRHRHCYAPGCRTGYAGVPAEKKLSLFNVPKDAVRRKAWERNLHRADKPLDENCAVCELHFEERYILRDYVHVVAGKEVRIARRVPAVTPEAVPTLLSNTPKYLSSKAPPKRAPRKRGTSTVLESPGCKRKKACTSVPTAVHDSGNCDDESAVECTQWPALDSNNLRDLKTPSAYWSVHNFSDYEGTVYALSSLEASSGTVTSERAVLFSLSATEITYRTFLKRKLVAEGAAKTVLEAERVISEASAFLACPGAHSTSAILEKDLTAKLLEKTTVIHGAFHSKTCTGMTTTKGVPCLSCRYLRKTLLTRMSRLRNRRHKQITTVGQKLRSMLQKHRRLSKRLISLKGQIESMKARNSAIKEETLAESIAMLPNKQQESVRHCFDACKRKSTRGMNFTKEWVLECILMKMRSPKLYRHIRKHNILVLPSNTTLKKYTAAYKSGFGFNKKVMEILKQKTSKMDSFSRHGGLLIDEMKLSEHLSMEKCAKLRGFVDLGPFTPPEDAGLPCDHGMVVMFVPFTGRFSQIIGTFAANGNAKGNLLCKILIEAVILAEQAGLFVDFVTCDGASWNRKMWTLMGIKASASKITCGVKHPVDAKRNLYFLSDFPHLLKCLRNSLLKGGFNTPDGRVSTYFVKEAFTYDKDNVTLKNFTAFLLDNFGAFDKKLKV